MKTDLALFMGEGNDVYVLWQFSVELCYRPYVFKWYLSEKIRSCKTVAAVDHRQAAIFYVTVFQAKPSAGQLVRAACGPVILIHMPASGRTAALWHGQKYVTVKADLRGVHQHGSIFG